MDTIMNKKLAFARLAHQIEELNRKNTQETKNQMWQQHQNLQRGNPQFSKN